MPGEEPVLSEEHEPPGEVPAASGAHAPPTEQASAAPGPHDPPPGEAQAAPGPYGPPPAYRPPVDPAAAPPYGPVPGDPASAPVLPLAHRGKRLLARMIDAVLMMAIAAVPVTLVWLWVHYLAPDGDSGLAALGAVGSFLIVTVVIVLYEGAQLAAWGRTLGKRWLGLRVVRATPPGAPLSTGKAYLRAAVYPPGFAALQIVPMVGLLSMLNVLWQFWDPPLHQCLHDKIVGTVVIDDRAARRALAGG
ncbi:hypothetical protein GCM10023195_46350 [Actinoallomurus liliacearum]|uniref:RDD domain-containing protein n=1 Tax=Actinoallomurus liliacearum TaxID=1080073 RepID=A0ABP8TL93_9ACTN